MEFYQSQLQEKNKNLICENKNIQQEGKKQNIEITDYTLQI